MNGGKAVECWEKKTGKHEEMFKSMWHTLKFCLKGGGQRARLKFRPLNEDSAICDCVEKVFTRRDVRDKIVRETGGRLR